MACGTSGHDGLRLISLSGNGRDFVSVDHVSADPMSDQEVCVCVCVCVEGGMLR